MFALNVRLLKVTPFLLTTNAAVWGCKNMHAARYQTGYIEGQLDAPKDA